MNEKDFDVLRFALIRLIAKRYKWTRQTACYYGVLVWALTHPAVLTVSDALRGPMVEWGQLVYAVRRYMGQADDDPRCVIIGNAILSPGWFYISHIGPAMPVQQCGRDYRRTQ